jgi:threonine-phosphate decarboxylase
VQSDNPAGALGDLLAMSAHNPSMNAVRDALPHQGQIVDFCVPVNPYFPTPQLLDRLRAQLPDLLQHYPDYAATHEAHIAAVIGVPAACVVVANGSTEIITSLCATNRGPMLTTVPTFGRWTDLPREQGQPLHTLAHAREHGWRIGADEVVAHARRCGARSVVLCNPNNPTGAWFDMASIEALARELGHLDALVVDESFIDFSGLESASALACTSPNLIVVKSMGKSLGWHGIRLGYAVANVDAAARLRARLPWWNVNGVAAFVLKELAENAETRAHYAQSFGWIARDRAYLLQALGTVPGLRVYPSRANFVYAELPQGMSGKALRAQLLARKGLYVRECSNKIGASESFLRLAVLPAAQTDLLVAGMQEVMADLQATEPA